ncbi:hypothetical protein [Catenulispora pinisilvae]|uniref:hypothetical protein n=1 Tax=Catenulispora pinisilvae TaxID=2705253 RepID=UPI00189271D6|nr:hypothetical protein [Catenulispora pinisilvae]
MAEIAALAEYAYAKDRSNSVARCALGLIRLARNRAGEARGLLVGAGADAGSEQERADILTVRALAERPKPLRHPVCSQNPDLLSPTAPAAGCARPLSAP